MDLSYNGGGAPAEAGHHRPPRMSMNGPRGGRLVADRYGSLAGPATVPSVRHGLTSSSVFKDRCGPSPLDFGWGPCNDLCSFEDAASGDTFPTLVTGG